MLCNVAQLTWGGQDKAMKSNMLIRQLMTNLTLAKADASIYLIISLYYRLI
jgi:hypothetical protein